MDGWRDGLMGAGGGRMDRCMVGFVVDVIIVRLWCGL